MFKPKRIFTLGSSRAIWWLHPFWFLLATLLPLSIFAYLIPQENYGDYWKCGKFFLLSDLGLTIWTIAAFGCGVLLAQSFAKPKNAQTQVRDILDMESMPWPIIHRFFNIGFWLTTIGYVIWFISCYMHGITLEMLAGVLNGDEGVTYIVTDLGHESFIAGVTTFTQFGPPVGLFAALLIARFGWRPVWMKLLVLILLSTVRAVLFSERLALIEVVLPAALLLMRTTLMTRKDPRSRRLITLLPIAAVVGVFLLFTFTEYFRSWVNFYAGEGDTVFGHSIMRLLGYYVTALNNGALYYREVIHLSFPFETMQWLAQFPLLDKVWPALAERHLDAEEVYKTLLEQESNLEFNNPSGVFVTFLDYGLIPALIFWWTLWGVVASVFYQSFQKGSPIGLLLYPFFFLGLTETSRISYWGSSRAFPAWILLFCALVLIVRGQSRNRVILRTRALQSQSFAALPPR